MFKRIEIYKRQVNKLNKLLGVENQVYEKHEDNSVFFADSLVLAPLMNVFVLWILNNALKKDIKRLYFLSRDGYPAFLVAQNYCRAWNLKIECRYIYCSRYALRIPMYSENIDEAIDYICSGGINVTWEKIFHRAGLDNKAIQIVLSDLSHHIDLQKKILYSELKNIKKILKKSEKFIELVFEKSQKEWDMLCGYFRQEGMLSDERIAIVDSGWIGTTQKSINDIRKRAGCISKIEGFYFGLYDIPVGEESNTYLSFYFAPGKRLFNKVLFSNCFFETVFSENSGTTIRYEKNAEKYLPVIKESELKNEKKIVALNKQLINYSNAVLCNVKENKLRELNFSKIRKIIENMLRTLTWNPTEDEVNYYGTLEFSDDLLDEDKQELAVIMTNRQLMGNHFWYKALSFLGFLNKDISESAWYEGSAVRKGDRFRLHRISYSLYKILVYLKMDLK